MNCHGSEPAVARTSELFAYCASNIILYALEPESSKHRRFGRVGLRRHVQVVVSSGAWVRIPQASVHFWKTSKKF